MNINTNTYNPVISAKQTFAGVSPVEVKGSATSAKIFASDIDYPVYDRVKMLCNHPTLKGYPIRLMPDVHPSRSSLVGLSVKSNPNHAIPGIVSGDIGCGVLCVSLDNAADSQVDYRQLDSIIRNYVSGKSKKEPTCKRSHLQKLSSLITRLAKKYKISDEKMLEQLGTLGGGNHFIEVDKDAKGNMFLVIHSGSRNCGSEVYKYYSRIAEAQNPYKVRELSYLNPSETAEYLHDTAEAMKYSVANRRIIADEILRHMGWKEKSSFEAVHNYIDEDGIIRKGAISAEAKQPVIIPLNMKDGAIIGKGKGNSDWNNTAPHGAGRQFSRSDASALITLEEYKKSMDGVYSTCISADTLDESPMAYKEPDEIIENISDTVDIRKIIKPTFNFKD